MPQARLDQLAEGPFGKVNAYFLRHLYIKTMVLPRQARDKHRENSKTCVVSLGVLCESIAASGPRGERVEGPEEDGQLAEDRRA